MSTGQTNGRFPAGLGWLLGFFLGFVFGVIAWLVAGDPIIGVILFAATGTPLGYTIEQGLDTRPLTEAQSRALFWLATAGIVVGALLLGYVIFVD